MDHVLGVDVEVDDLVGGNREDAGVGVLEAGIAEVPDPLAAEDLDMHRVRRLRRRVAQEGQLGG